MTVDNYYLNIALAVAQKSTCLKKQYGAVIVKNSEILATGFNGPPRHEPHCLACTKKDGHKDFDEYCSCPAVHAEMNAIISAPRRDMLGSTLYLAGYDVITGTENMTVAPCEICLRLIKNAGVDLVITNQGTIYKRNESGILEKCEINV